MGRNVVVHASNINLCQFSEAMLQGHGLRDNDLVNSFASMIRRKIEEGRKQHNRHWPYTVDELLNMLDSGPLKEIYNVIYGSIDPKYKVNEYGYAIITSRQIATKIWLLASDWESLLTKERSPKQTVAAMTVHRLTSSKEVITVLHKVNNTISYNEVRIQNMAWARLVAADRRKTALMAKGIPTHATIYNND